MQVAYPDAGFTIRYENPSKAYYGGPAATYQRLYDSLGRKTNILTTIDGVTVFIQPQGEYGPGSFDMVVGGTRVVAHWILSNDQLTAMAQNIIEATTAATSTAP